MVELRYFDQEAKQHIVPYVIEPSAGADRATLAFLCDAYEDALVKAPPAEETAKLRELVESFVKSAAKRDNLAGRRQGSPGDRGRGHRPGAARDPAAAAGPGRRPRRQPDRGHEEGARRGGRVAEEHTRTVLQLHPQLAPIKVAVFPLKKNEPRLVEMARGLKRELQASGIRTVYDDTGAIGKLYRRQDEVGTPWCVTVDFKSLEDGTVTVRDRDTMAQDRVKADDLESTVAGRAARAERG